MRTGDWGKHGERGSACWLNVNCTICNYNLYNLLLQFWICSFCIFTSSKINAGWGLGKHGWWKRRWASRFDDSPLLFVLLLCICLVAQCWLLLLSSSSQKFVTCARRVCKLLKQADDSSLFLVLSSHLKSRVIFVLEKPLKVPRVLSKNCQIFSSSFGKFVNTV